jgi:hypothetical protein
MKALGIQLTIDDPSRTRLFRLFRLFICLLRPQLANSHSQSPAREFDGLVELTTATATRLASIHKLQSANAIGSSHPLLTPISGFVMNHEFGSREIEMGEMGEVGWAFNK